MKIPSDTWKRQMYESMTACMPIVTMETFAAPCTLSISSQLRRGELPYRRRVARLYLVCHEAHLNERNASHYHDVVQSLGVVLCKNDGRAVGGQVEAAFF